MMSGRVVVTVAIVSILLVIVSLTIHTPDQQQGTTFEAQPSDVYVTCNTSIEDVYFRCQHEGSGGWPRWFINSVLHSANDYNLQEQYNINKTLLAPKRITPELNNARYQCQINTLSEGRRRQTLYNSTEGQLIIDCQAPSVKSFPVYDHQTSQLVAINTTITNALVNEPTIFYKITYYSGFNSVDVCNSTLISASSCTNGVCTSIISTAPGLGCSGSSDIVVNVITTNNYHDSTIIFSRSDPIKIGAVNELVNLSLVSKDEDFVINWVFLNISKTDERKKILTVMYSGDVANCRDQSSNLEPLSEASMDSGNTISCGINLDRLGNLSKIYFCATATVQGSIIANIEGILDIKNKASAASTSASASDPSNNPFEAAVTSNFVTISGWIFLCNK